MRSSDAVTCPQKLHIHRPVLASTATYRLRKAPQPWHRSASRRSHRALSPGAANGWMTNPKGRPSGVVSEHRVGTVCALKRQHGSTVLPRISVACSGAPAAAGSGGAAAACAPECARCALGSTVGSMLDGGKPLPPAFPSDVRVCCSWTKRTVTT